MEKQRHVFVKKDSGDIIEGFYDGKHFTPINSGFILIEIDPERIVDFDVLNAEFKKIEIDIISESFIKKEAEENELKKLMNQRGFEVKSIGGNCTAYTNSTGTIKISKMGKPYAPDKINEPVLVAFYENEQFFADAVFVNVLEFFRTGKIINDYFEGEL